jgi:hypothetical protein
MLSEWNKFVQKIYQEGKKSNPKYQFKNALSDASARKSEMGSSGPVAGPAPKPSRGRRSAKKACMKKCRKTCKTRKMRGGRSRRRRGGFTTKATLMPATFPNDSNAP